MYIHYNENPRSNVIRSYLHMYGNDNVRLSGDATNGWIISWGGYATDVPPPVKLYRIYC